MKRIFLASVIILLTLTSIAQKTFTITEKKIIDQVHNNIPQSFYLLKSLVDINSGTLNVQGVKKTGDILGNEFKKIGFTTEWIPMPESVKRAGHLVASIKGKKGQKLFLIGHLDTVFEPDSLGNNSYKILNDSTAGGQGVVDIKGGDVIIFTALQTLQQLGLLKNATITAYFTGDEENAGKPEEISRGDFIERAKQHDVALGYEGAKDLHEVATARRGASTWQLKVYGIQAHSAGIFKPGYGAIYEAARILNSFREQLDTEKYLTFNPGLIAGGKEVFYDSAKLRSTISGKTNIIAPFTEVTGDLRFLTHAQKELARKHMQNIVYTNNLPETHAEISFLDGIPAMEPAEKNDLLVSKLNEICMALGTGEVHAGDPGSRGAGDISYIAKYVSAIDGLGAIGKGSHAPGETIDIKNFRSLVERSALLIYRLTR